VKSVSLRRLSALCIKETRQILRDPSSGVIAFILPMILLVIFGYGLNLDTTRLRMGLCDEDGGPAAASFTAKLTGSTYFEIHPGSRAELDALLETGAIRGYTVLAQDFSRIVDQGRETAPIQVITDGAEPNTANFVAAFMKNVWQEWLHTKPRIRAGTPSRAQGWRSGTGTTRRP